MSPPSDDDKSKKAILERRARFMAAALAAATGCAKVGEEHLDAGQPDAGVAAGARPRPKACASFYQNNTYTASLTPQEPDSKK